MHEREDVTPDNASLSAVDGRTIHLSPERPAFRWKTTSHSSFAAGRDYVEGVGELGYM